MLEMCLSGENNGIAYFSGRPEGLPGDIDYSVGYETVFASRVNNFLSIYIFIINTQVISYLN